YRRQNARTRASSYGITHASNYPRPSTGVRVQPKSPPVGIGRATGNRRDLPRWQGHCIPGKNIRGRLGGVQAFEVSSTKGLSAGRKDRQESCQGRFQEFGCHNGRKKSGSGAAGENQWAAW